ncbi:hypothetical protein, partial [Nocardioides luteus]|uniref:hypothetical protein n=1 Tax=Nocardioides luteus TaxID=1844 RepID=UPI001C42EDBC
MVELVETTPACDCCCVAGVGRLPVLEVSIWSGVKDALRALASLGAAAACVSRTGDAPVVELVETALRVTDSSWLVWAADPLSRVSIRSGGKEGPRAPASPAVAATWCVADRYRTGGRACRDHPARNRSSGLVW